ncbi:fibrobacter succinogenes major paralogous domain-containing protein [Pinibacter aurantiacus]|uniref:Fibrobacter succinogenes major paralogous domain-containing protein n=1 Tax=Pinibacter aurantiacus TaxID=2851599 RepID=A0A9E2SCI7_9BACT|nr:fibrobacter succinogenes major paralogous domain-containing protein [Pinibacter aurantiacus]MBV4357905.1 fibrobacter succinogenes major paralogous domain-containing protein [Pinibacter aurantiacus]
MRKRFFLSLACAAFFIGSGCKPDAIKPANPPQAQNVNISGTVAITNSLTADYTYYSSDGAAESGTTYQWYRAADTSGAGIASIVGATSKTYIVQIADAGYYLKVMVTPGAATGLTPGIAASSVYTKQVPGLTPVAQNVSISGTVAYTNTLTASYAYYTPTGATESGTTYQWYRAADTAGTSKMAISGATAKTYDITVADMSYYLMVSVTPGAATGPTPGIAANSAYTAQVPSTFTFNGLTYGIIKSPTTGRIWLDRNLGATRVAQSSTDYLAYGDLYQWGRPADGHEKINWTSSTTGTPVNGTTTTLATSDIPGNALFIISYDSPFDWRSDGNSNRWNVNPQIQCPPGFQVPTYDQWNQEADIKDAATAFSLLKLPAAGLRNNGDGFSSTGTAGAYWGSTAFVSNGSSSYRYFASPSAFSSVNNYRVFGFSVRCIAQ